MKIDFFIIVIILLSKLIGVLKKYETMYFDGKGVLKAVKDITYT